MHTCGLDRRSPRLFYGRRRSPLTTYLNIAQIIISVALIILVTIQGKGSSVSRMLGGEGMVFKTRRGVEKTLFRLTIVLVVVFFVMSVVSVLVQT